MEIHNSLNGVNSFASISPAATSSEQVKGTSSAGQAASVSDHATLSSTGSGMSQIATDGDVRMDKVASIQAALSAGTYNVPASKVASSIVDSLLGK